jgi:hypothetical protein
MKALNALIGTYKVASLEKSFFINLIISSLVSVGISSAIVLYLSLDSASIGHAESLAAVYDFVVYVFVYWYVICSIIAAFVLGLIGRFYFKNATIFFTHTIVSTIFLFFSLIMGYSAAIIALLLIPVWILAIRNSNKKAYGTTNNS